MEIVRIPIERIKALRGDANATLDMLEEKLKVSLEVDPIDGAVELEGEPVDEFFAKDVIKAIGRGFEPRTALKLLSDDYSLKIIDLRDHANKPDAVSRIKARIIGLKGKAKKIMEEEGECDLAIHGHTVSVIAKLDVIDVASTALFKLIEGQPHSAVYFYLEKMKRKRKEDEIMESRSGRMSKK